MGFGEEPKKKRGRKKRALQATSMVARKTSTKTSAKAGKQRKVGRSSPAATARVMRGRIRNQQRRDGDDAAGLSMADLDAVATEAGPSNGDESMFVVHSANETGADLSVADLSTLGDSTAEAAAAPGDDGMGGSSLRGSARRKGRSKSDKGARAFGEKKSLKRGPKRRKASLPRSKLVLKKKPLRASTARPEHPSGMGCVSLSFSVCFSGDAGVT